MLINNAHFCYEGDSFTNNNNEKKQHFLQHKKTEYTRKAYMDRSMSMRRQVGFAAVFMEDASIHTAVMTVVKGALKKIKKRWIIYIDFMQSIE